MKNNLGLLTAAMFTAFLVGMVVLRVAAKGPVPTEQASTVPNANGTQVDVDRDTDAKRTVKELEARRNGALREAKRLSEKISKLRTSRVEQLEAELAQARREVRRFNQRIKYLEDNRYQATRETQKALKKLLEELSS